MFCLGQNEFIIYHFVKRGMILKSMGGFLSCFFFFSFFSVKLAFSLLSKYTFGIPATWYRLWSGHFAFKNIPDYPNWGNINGHRLLFIRNKVIHCVQLFAHDLRTPADCHEN